MKQKLVGILAVCATALIAYVIFANTNGAKDKIAGVVARDICGSITMGMRMDQVSNIAINKKGWFRAYAPDGARVGADGWYLKCRCNIIFKNGGVASISQPVCVD